MNIHLHIDRLVLDRIDLPVEHRDTLVAAVTAELSRRLAEGGLTPEMAAGLAVPVVPGGFVQSRTASGAPGGSGDDAARFGSEIAAAVYRGIGTASQGGGTR